MPHITKKLTRPGGTIIIRPLTAILIVVAGGGVVTVVERMEEWVFQVSDAKAKAVNAEILITH